MSEFLGSLIWVYSVCPGHLDYSDKFENGSLVICLKGGKIFYALSNLWVKLYDFEIYCLGEESADLYRLNASVLILESQTRLWQSDQGLHCSPFHLHFLDTFLYDKTTLFEFEERNSSCFFFQLFFSTGPPHDKTNKMTFVRSEDSDQHGHPPSLIRVFAVFM